MFIASDFDSFRRHFGDRLENILDSDELGAFILVLANSMQDAATRQRLQDRLQLAFARHCASFEQGSLQAAPDDMQVFEKLMHSGIDRYGVWPMQRKHPWIQFYNPLRALRPPRASAQVIDSLRKPFDDSAFHFNKPFLRAEQLWRGSVQTEQEDFDCTVLYNKFPFLPYHFILVPNAADAMPQYLQQPFHELVWELCARHAAVLPGLGFGYNSLGACASVNHLHFQGFVYEPSLPVELDVWQHHGGDSEYPMQCAVFEDVDSAWQAMRLLHLNNQAYNLLYRPQRCYVLCRRMQGDPAVRQRVTGAGWIEAVGVFSEFERDAIDSMSTEQLSEDIRSLSAAPISD